MNSNKKVYLLVVLTLLIGCITVFVPAASAQDIHVLMVIDNGDPKARQRRGTDKDRIETLMKSSVALMLEKETPGATVAVTELLSNDRRATKENIFEWIQNLNPGTDDVVFVYFSGPGAANKVGAKERYLLVQEGRKLYRKVFVKAMEGLNCRLKIFITETDSAGPLVTAPMPLTDDVPKPIDTGTSTLDNVSKPTAITSTDCLRQLFLEHEGFLNLTSTSLGHLSLGSSLTGGYFTISLMDGLFPDDMSEVDHNPKDGFVSWEEVFKLTKKHLNDLYQANSVDFSDRLKNRMQEIKQKTQVPEALSDFPKRIR